MNCPRCRSGILELCWFLELQNDQPVTAHYQNKNQKNDPCDKHGLKVYVCSKEDCGHTELRAAPGTQTFANRQIREKMYSV